MTALVVAHAMAAAYVLAALFDWRVFQTGWYDYAWHLELAWQAREGDWSGRDFHYPRGPAWQAVAYLASQPWRDAMPVGETLAGIVLAFRLASIAGLAWVAWRRVDGPWIRVAVLAIFATVSFGAGEPTFRAVLSLLIVMVHVPMPGSSHAPSARRALPAAALTVFALLVSFDRFAVAVLSLAAASAAEWMALRRAGAKGRVAIERALHAAAMIAALLLVVAALGALAGADPIAYVEGQRHIATGYATGMRTPWYVGVPPANVVALFLFGCALALSGLARREPLHAVAWIAGAIPAAIFGAVTSDQGHMFMAILPLVCVLVLLGASPRSSRVTRSGAALVAAISLLGWFGTHPDAFSLSPSDVRDAWLVARGEKHPERDFRAQHGRAAHWARDLVRREHPRCIAVWPSFSMVHALAGVPGPTELAMRWNDSMQRELAARIEEEDCPVYLHHLLSFDDIGGAWFLGPDFITLAERYRFERRVGAELVSMRRRTVVARANERPIEAPIVGRTLELDVPGELVIPLGRAIAGEHAVRIDYELGLSAWRAQLGGIPLGEVRFEHRGAPIGEWETLHHLRAGEGSAYLSPDPEALEWRWMTPTRVERRVEADAIRIRLAPRGLRSPSRLTFRVRALTEIEPPDPPHDEPASHCEGEIDLLARAHQGRMYARMVAPRPSRVHFQLQPNAPLFPLAEVFFPVRPCADACVFAELGVAAPATESDGVSFEVHVLRREHRALLFERHVPAGVGSISVELPIHEWPNEPQLLRMGTRPGANESSDYAYVTLPRIGPCTARTSLAQALESGRARSEGISALRGEELEVAPEGGRLRYALRVVPGTCVSVDVAADARDDVELGLRVAVDGLEHVLHEGSVQAGVLTGLHDFTDRDVELVLEARSRRGAIARLLGARVHECGR